MTECYSCGKELHKDEGELVVVDYETVKRVNDRHAKIISPKYEKVCSDCEGSEDFYCYGSGVRWKDAFEYREDTDGDCVAEPVAVAIGMHWSEYEQAWLYADEENLDDDDEDYDEDDDDELVEEEQMTDKKYVDFYWELRDGDRHCTLQLEDGGEKHASEALEEVIYDRIEAAGADKGDPQVVNVYTRLELIDRGILSPEYVL